MLIGIVGYGSIGKRHAQNAIDLGHEVKTCDINESANYQSLNALIEASPEVVIICSPPEFHFKQAYSVLTAGINCFIEKPITQLPWQTSALISIARASNLHLAVGYQLRWQLDGVMAEAGKNITWECSQDMRLWPSQYRKDILEEFSHEIDAAVFVNGPVAAVTAKETTYGWVIHLRHINCWSEIHLNPYSVARERGSYIGVRNIWGFSEEHNDQAYKMELQSFLSVCQGQPWDERLCSGAEAAHVVRIIEACRTSASECKVVTLA